MIVALLPSWLHWPALVVAAGLGAVLGYIGFVVVRWIIGKG